MENQLTDFRAKVLAWIDANPNKQYTTSYDDKITDKQAGMILNGEFDAVYEEISEWFIDVEPEYVWGYWRSEFCTEFGFESWDRVPDQTKEFIQENANLDLSEYIRDAIKNWNGNITATIRKPARKGKEDYIFAPSNYLESDDKARARYLINAFGIEPKTDDYVSKAAQVTHDLDIVYGGYDAEQLTLTGRIDLMEIWDAYKAPTHVVIGPSDADNLIFYDHHNGCGNMGQFRLTKTRTMPAVFMVDGSHGYGVDSCYGFTGEYWRHSIRWVAK